MFKIGEPHELVTWTAFDLELKEFAKLIVRECANIADEQCVIATDHVFGVGQELLDHFGVKE
jgi:hypothetical protein